MESMPVVDPEKYRKELLSRSRKLNRRSSELIARLVDQSPFTKRGTQWRQEAISKLNEALSINPRDTDAFFNLGCIDMLFALWNGDSDKARAILRDTNAKVAQLIEELKKESLSCKNEGQVQGLGLMNAPSKDANTQQQHPQLQQQHPQLQQQQQRQPMMQISQQQPQMYGQYQMQFPSSMGTSQFEGWQLPFGPGQYQFEGQYPMQLGVGHQFSATQGTPNCQMVTSIGNPGNLIPIQQQQQKREQHHHGPQGAFCNFVPSNSWSYDTANYGLHGGVVFNIRAANPGYLIPIQQQQQQQYGPQGNFVPSNPRVYDNANYGHLGGVGIGPGHAGVSSWLNRQWNFEHPFYS